VNRIEALKAARLVRFAREGVADPELVTLGAREMFVPERGVVRN
jgi:hypothetical protein